MNWHSDIERILEKIRVNCIILSKAHKNRYQKLSKSLRYFRLPVIILSGINSVVSVGFQSYINQSTISLATCLISLTCGIIGSIELYLAIQSRMENELNTSKSYYLLSVDIFKYLALDREHRDIAGDLYMDKTYETYCKLFENSNILFKKLLDKLTPLSNLPKDELINFDNNQFEMDEFDNLDNKISGMDENISLLSLSNNVSEKTNKIREEFLKVLENVCEKKELEGDKVEESIKEPQV